MGRHVYKYIVRHVAYIPLPQLQTDEDGAKE